MKAKVFIAFISVLMLSLIPLTTSNNVGSVIPTSNEIQIPTLAYDVSLANCSDVNDPNYWGNFTLFMSAVEAKEGVFYVQRGGCHNWCFAHSQWNESLFIVKITNCEFINDQVIVHNNETHVYFSNGIDKWIPDMLSPISNEPMHALEYSPYSLALYWFDEMNRLIIGQILNP